MNYEVHCVKRNRLIYSYKHSIQCATYVRIN